MILIVAEIIQKGLTISSSTSDIPYQYSGNIQMQFIKDEGYDNFSVIGFYRTNYFEKTQLLEIDENGVFSLNKDAFQKDGLRKICSTRNRKRFIFK